MIRPLYDHWFTQLTLVDEITNFGKLREKWPYKMELVKMYIGDLCCTSSFIVFKNSSTEKYAYSSNVIFIYTHTINQ